MALYKYSSFPFFFLFHGGPVVLRPVRATSCLNKIESVGLTKKIFVLTLDWRSDCKCCKMLFFLALKKLRHYQPTHMNVISTYIMRIICLRDKILNIWLTVSVLSLSRE